MRVRLLRNGGRIFLRKRSAGGRKRERLKVLESETAVLEEKLEKTRAELEKARVSCELARKELELKRRPPSLSGKTKSRGRLSGS